MQDHIDQAHDTERHQQQSDSQIAYPAITLKTLMIFAQVLGSGLPIFTYIESIMSNLLQQHSHKKYANSFKIGFCLILSDSLDIDELQTNQCLHRSLVYSLTGLTLMRSNSPLRSL